MKVLSDEKLQAVVEKNLSEYNLENLNGQKYDFSMSDLILKASFRTPVHIDEISEERRGEAIIEPGETVFVMSKEYIKLPPNISISLSPKRGFGHGGWC